MRGNLTTQKFTTVILLVLLLTISAQAGSVAPWSGKVVGVSDGDTITVMKEGRGVKVLLSEIDCPEKRQPFGSRAKKYTSDLCYGKIVTVKPTDVDRYGRIVGHVVLPGGKVLSHSLVRAGLAWQYRKYSKSRKLATLEAEAREAKVGVWSMPDPVPPWEWRRGKNRENKNESAASPIKRNPLAGVYHGNINSKIFHAPHCRYFNCKNCSVIFHSRDDVVAAGYRPGKICKP